MNIEEALFHLFEHQLAGVKTHINVGQPGSGFHTYSGSRVYAGIHCLRCLGLQAVILYADFELGQIPKDRVRLLQHPVCVDCIRRVESERLFKENRQRLKKEKNL